MQLRMIGKILSGLSHDVKNHLALIKESTGLIVDIIGSEKSLATQELRQCIDILNSVRKQIGKTSELCNYLNRFAHRMEQPLSVYKVNESLEELIALLQKFVSQKKIRLEKDFHDELQTIHGNPALLQFLVSCLVEEMFYKLDKSSTITIKTNISNGLLMIDVIGRGNYLKTVKEDSFCSNEIQQQVINQIYGNISKTDKGIAITIPITTKSAAET
jgi:K+-sensing histidine kinase KdpD